VLHRAANVHWSTSCVSRWCAQTCVQLHVPVHLHTLWGVLQSKCGGRIRVGCCRDASRSAGCRLGDQLGRLSSLTTCCMLAVCPSLWKLMGACARQMSMIVSVRLCGLMCEVMGGGWSFAFTLIPRTGVQGHTNSLHRTHMGCLTWTVRAQCRQMCFGSHPSLPSFQRLSIMDADCCSGLLRHLPSHAQLGVATSSYGADAWALWAFVRHAAATGRVEITLGRVSSTSEAWQQHQHVLVLVALVVGVAACCR
jgi:hypothetical protein